MDESKLIGLVLNVCKFYVDGTLNDEEVEIIADHVEYPDLLHSVKMTLSEPPVDPPVRMSLAMTPAGEFGIVYRPCKIDLPAAQPRERLSTQPYKPNRKTKLTAKHVEIWRQNKIQGCL